MTRTAGARAVEQAHRAIKALDEQLPGPCCGGPAIHDQGVDAIRDLLAALAAAEAERDEARKERDAFKGMLDALTGLDEMNRRLESALGADVMQRRAEEAEQQLAEARKDVERLTKELGSKC